MTDEAKALVERLRNRVEYYQIGTTHRIRTGDELAEIAADRIEQLEREKAVVSDLWEQQKEIALGYLADCNKAADRIEALEAENERLRGALAMCVAEMMRASGRLEIIATCNEDRRIVAALSGTCDYVRSVLGGSNE